MISKSIFSLFVAGLAIVFIGCGGGGSNGSGTGTATGSGTATGGSQAAADVAAGTTQLNALLANQNSITVAGIQASEKNFANARGLDPTNKNGNAGFAITLIALDSQNLINLFPGKTTLSDTTTQTILGKRLSAARFGMLGNLLPPLSVNDLMPIDGSGHLTMLQAPKLTTSTRDYPTSPTYQQVEALLIILNADLATVDTVLSDEANLPSDLAPLTLTDPQNPAGTVKIGTVEIRAARASVEALESAVDFVLVYNFGFTPASYPYNSVFNTVFNTSGAAISPSTYLPSGGFGTINSNGQTLANKGVAAFMSAMNSADAAISAYTSRGSTGWAVNPNSINSTSLSQFQSGEATARADLGADFADPSAPSVTVRLKEWLAALPTNLVALAPAIHDNGGQVTYSATDFPDLSFGGLFSPALTPSQINLGTGATFGVSDSQTVAQVMGGLFLNL